MTLYVVRHGRTEANASGLLLGRADPGLDEVGRRQASAIAAAVPSGARVVSSPLRRCRETAAAICGGADPDRIDTDDRLVELNYGELDLVPLSEIPAELGPPGGPIPASGPRGARRWRSWPAGWAPPSTSWPRRHQRRRGGGDPVSPVKAALAWCLGVGVEVSWRSFVGQASITRIGFTNGRGPSLLTFNAESHLDGI